MVFYLPTKIGYTYPYLLQGDRRVQMMPRCWGMYWIYAYHPYSDNALNPPYL